jgi:hypothetical protein
MNEIRFSRGIPQDHWKAAPGQGSWLPTLPEVGECGSIQDETQSSFRTAKPVANQRTELCKRN